MTRREVDPLAPLKPMARLAALGLVVSAVMLATGVAHASAAPESLETVSPGSGTAAPTPHDGHQPLPPAAHILGGAHPAPRSS